MTGARGVSEKKVIVVYADRCVGCKTCEIACAVAHSKSGDVIGAAGEDPRPKARVSVEKGEALDAPLQCRQCAKALCIEICPADALSRESAEDPVVVDHEACRKCGFCTLACPYGMVALDDEGKVLLKCDQCYARVQRGEVPACVEACPTKTLEFRAIDEVERGDYLTFITQDENGDSA